MAGTSVDAASCRISRGWKPLLQRKRLRFLRRSNDEAIFVRITKTDGTELSLSNHSMAPPQAARIAASRMKSRAKRDLDAGLATTDSEEHPPRSPFKGGLEEHPRHVFISGISSSPLSPPSPLYLLIPFSYGAPGGRCPFRMAAAVSVHRRSSALLGNFAANRSYTAPAAPVRPPACNACA